MNFNKFKELFLVLCEMYDREPSKGLTKLYWTSLQDLSDDQFSRAVDGIVKNRVYSKLPMVAELREAALGSTEDRALLALQKVIKAIENHGAYESVLFDDPIIPAVIETVDVEGKKGWIGLCSMELDDFKFWRKDFVKLYKAYAKNPPQKAKPLSGIHQLANKDDRQPALIGGKMIEGKND